MTHYVKKEFKFLSKFLLNLKNIFLNILILFFLFLINPLDAQRTYIYCGSLIDGVQKKVLKNQTIIVEGKEIISVEKGFKNSRENVNIIDLRDKTIMPGLIDMHVHIEHETGKNRYLERFTLNDADIAFQSTVYAKRTLMAGFTTVRDLGGTGVNIALRNAINKGIIKGPRIITAGKSIATTGGHADLTNGMKKALMEDPTAKQGVVNGPDECRKAVRQRYKNGADMIKITATGGVLSVAKDGSGPQFINEELQAIISTAKDYGMHVAAHAHGAEGMKRAVIAGVTTIEHGTKMTTEIMDLMKEKGTYYVPTVTAGKFVAEKAKEANYYPALVIPKALEIGPQIQKTFSKAYKRGVKIAFGTDAGVFPHGENAKEFTYMVEAGMPLDKVIQCATIVNATILGLKDKIGSIEKKKLADIIAVNENPFDNTKTLENVIFVMKEGIVYKNVPK